MIMRGIPNCPVENPFLHKAITSIFSRYTDMGKTNLEFIARLTMEDGSVIERKVSAGDGIISPSEVDPDSLDSILGAFGSTEQAAILARNQVSQEIMQAWIEEQAKKGGSSQNSK